MKLTTTIQCFFIAAAVVLGQQLQPGVKTQPPADTLYSKAPSPIVTLIYSIVRTTVTSLPPAYATPPPAKQTTTSTSTAAPPPALTTSTSTKAPPPAITTSTNTAAPSSSTSHAPSTEHPKNPTDACWLTPDCLSLPQNISSCYALTTDLHQVIPSLEQSTTYRDCLCRFGFERMNTTAQPSDPTYPISNCLLCMQQAGVSIWNAKLPTFLMRAAIVQFCSSKSPDFIAMITTVLAFLQHVKPPDTITLPAGLSALTSLASTATLTPTTAAGEWWSRTLGMHDTIPTQYLAQLPPNWPFTTYNPFPHVHTTSFALTHPNTTGVTVAWVYASVLPNARPLFTPYSGSGEGGLYQPALANWTHGFLTETVGSLVTGGTTTTTAERMAKMPRVTGGEGLGSTVLVAGESMSSVTVMTDVAPATAGGVEAPVLTGEEAELSRLRDELQSLRSRMGYD